MGTACYAITYNQKPVDCVVFVNLLDVIWGDLIYLDCHEPGRKAMSEGCVMCAASGTLKGHGACCGKVQMYKMDYNRRDFN